MLRILSVLLFCAGIFCLAQSHAQVPMKVVQCTISLCGAGLGAPGGSAPASTCSTITGLVSGIIGCWNADEGVTQVGGAVTVWTDQVNSYALGLNQAGTNLVGTSPMFSSSSYNGIAGITCAAASRQYLATTSNAIALNNSNTSFFMSAIITSSTQSFGRALSFLAHGETEDFQSSGSQAPILRNASTTTFESFGLDGSLSAGTISLSTPTRLGAVNDGSNNTLYINNTGQTPVAFVQTLGITGGNQLAMCQAAQLLADGDALMDGTIRRILFISKAVNSTDRGNIDTWLQQ